MAAIIFDMDGTLADVRGIRHYVEGKRRDFDSFHRASAWVGPHDWVLQAAHDAPKLGYDVIVVTARDERYRRETMAWLAKYEVKYDLLLMRPMNDGRADAIVKREILDTILSKGFDPLIAFDDRDDILEVWRSAGILGVKVGQ